MTKFSVFNLNIVQYNISFAQKHELIIILNVNDNLMLFFIRLLAVVSFPGTLGNLHV